MYNTKLEWLCWIISPSVLLDIYWIYFPLFLSSNFGPVNLQRKWVWIGQADSDFFIAQIWSEHNST
jgi:hypothetical protein